MSQLDWDDDSKWVMLPNGQHVFDHLDTHGIDRWPLDAPCRWCGQTIEAMDETRCCQTCQEGFMEAGLDWEIGLNDEPVPADYEPPVETTTIEPEEVWPGGPYSLPTEDL